jgi:hypothetical protein
MPKAPREMEFRVVGAYGARTREPFVQITLGEEMIQVIPATARQLAAMLYEAADASEGDAFLMRFAREVLELPDYQCAQLLLRFRNERQARDDRDRPGLEPVEPLGRG